MTDTPDTPLSPRIGRRQLLIGGGATISLGALLAACGGDEGGAPGRVGYAPPVTALPNEDVTDAVLLRTAQSMEHTILDVYARIAESGALEGRAADLLDRLVQDHDTTAADVGRLVGRAGGEPYPCANAWYLDRIIPGIYEAIEGDEAAGIAPSDDPARDWLTVMDAMESMISSTYQGFVERLSDQQLRAEVIALAALSARHAAAIAITATGAPEAYASPVVRGEEEVTPDESGLTPLYAIPNQFGMLSPYTLVVGAPSEAGTRFTLPVETPADNSYAYTSQSCSA